MSVAIATAATMRGLDEDEPLLVAALQRLGVEAEAAVWDDAAVDWARYDLVVVRSTWDYVPRRDEFLAWADRVAAVTAIANPTDVLRWNTDKCYLRDLEAAGVPIVPTVWLEPGREVALPSWDELVVKPAVSAGAKDTARYRNGERAAAVAHAGRLVGAGRTVMVQPYIAAVDDAGETAVLFLGGDYSHAIRKGPILEAGAPPPDEPFAPEDISPRAPSAAELALARATLDALPGGADRLLYARVDVVTDDDGSPLALELELTEPSLFLPFAEGSADRLAAAVATATR